MPKYKWPDDLVKRPPKRCGWCGCPTTSKTSVCPDSICRGAEAIHQAKRENRP